MQLSSTGSDDEEENCPLAALKPFIARQNQENCSGTIANNSTSDLTISQKKKRTFSDIANSNCDDIFSDSKHKIQSTFKKSISPGVSSALFKEGYSDDLKKRKFLDLFDTCLDFPIYSRKISNVAVQNNATSQIFKNNDITANKLKNSTDHTLSLRKSKRIFKNKSESLKVVDATCLNNTSHVKIPKTIEHITVDNKPSEEQNQNLGENNISNKTNDFGNKTLISENICDNPKRKYSGGKRRKSYSNISGIEKRYKKERNSRHSLEEKENELHLEENQRSVLNAVTSKDIEIHNSSSQVAPSTILQDSTYNRHKLSLAPTRSAFSISSQINLRKNNSEIFIDKTLSAGIGTNFIENQIDKENMSVHDYRLIPDDRSVGNGLLQRTSHNIANDDSSISVHNHCPSSSQPYMATLCNIGNTCYLNSVVYTLRFAPQFLHNLHHLVEDLSYVHKTVSKNRAKSSSLGRNISSFHSENSRSLSSRDLASHDNPFSDMSKSKQQMATEKLHELYQNLNKNERIESTEPFHADCFLRAIQDVSAIFEGNQQQDAHEFLMCVLDSIRETCLDLIKAITEYPDVIANGHISTTEQANIQPPVTKEQEQPPRQISSGTSKSSFFSRISKRKDFNKDAKNVQTSAPTKDNSPLTSSELTESTVTSKSNSNSKSTTENDIWFNDKEQLNEKIKKLGLDFFSEDFEGITVSSTKCLSCETVTKQKETMIDIAVPITSYENINAADKSHLFIQNSCITRENFRGDNKYRCEKCVGYTEAIRSISYEVLPRLLIIQLSRFSGGMEKISRYFPTPFTLQCFCAKCCEMPESKKLHVYKLYSVITHVGATMSVGHYVAYTCYLDIANDYINCNKNAKRQSNLNFANASATSSNNINTNSTGNSTSEKNIGLMKKKIFGRNKASSSGDMSKVKNSLPSKTYSNDVDKSNKNTTCESYSCCGIRLKNNLLNNHSNLCNNAINPIFPDVVDENQSQYMYNHSGFFDSATNRNNMGKHKAQNSEPIWYMCDDDKIKAMSQREFEDLLSPKRKIMVTPYLLFYARSEMQ